MGCTQSKKTKETHSTSYSEATKTSPSQISIKPADDSYGYDDIDKSILPTLSEAVHEIRFSEHPVLPSSQSYEIASVVINSTSSSNEDEKRTIESYITSAIEYRNKHGGKCDLKKQLEKKRLEVICVGSFIQMNNSTKKYDILSYDTYIPNTNIKYRPDLILRDKETNMIVHVEIDEKAHLAYDPTAEADRERQIEDHFKNYEYMRIRFNPNKYTNKVEMAVKFAQLLNTNDGIISVVHRRKRVK